MAQYKGTVEGSRGEASRLGGKSSGLYVTANGWRFGVSVHLTFDEEAGEDVAVVELTSGSGGGKRKSLGSFRAADLVG